jgi:hypothetical protein
VVSVNYRVHGADVRSELRLPLEPIRLGRLPSVEVRRAAARHVPDEPAPGASYGSIGEAPRREWWTRDAQTWRIRIAGCCELRIGPPWDVVEVDVDPDGRPEVIGERVLKTGVVFALERQGLHVLHASAVSVHGATIGFVGASGSGKSTLAALLCADGGALVSDDQLRVELRGDGEVVCHPGLAAIRLRADVQSVARLFGGGTDHSLDGRTVILPRGANGPVRLDVLALPMVSDAVSSPTVTPLSRGDALLALGRTRPTPAIRSWVQARFHANTDVVERLPAHRVVLPLGSVPSRLEREALLEPLLAGAPRSSSWPPRRAVPRRRR